VELKSYSLAPRKLLAILVSNFTLLLQLKMMCFAYLWDGSRWQSDNSLVARSNNLVSLVNLRPKAFDIAIPHFVKT